MENKILISEKEYENLLKIKNNQLKAFMKYYYKNHDKLTHKYKEYYESKKEEIKAQKKLYYQQNREKIIEKNIARYKAKKAQKSVVEP